MRKCVWLVFVFWILAGTSPRTDEEELGSTVQRAGWEETCVWGWEGRLGGSAENPWAAETGCFQVSILSLNIFNHCLVVRACKYNHLPLFLTQDNGKEQEERKNLLKRNAQHKPSVLHVLFSVPSDVHLYSEAWRDFQPPQQHTPQHSSVIFFTHHVWQGNNCSHISLQNFTLSFGTFFPTGECMFTWNSISLYLLTKRRGQCLSELQYGINTWCRDHA